MIKVIDLGIEILEIDKNGEYPINIYDKEMFRGNFLSFYKIIDNESYNKIIELMSTNKNTEKELLDDVLKDDDLTMSKIEVDKLLRFIRKDKMKKLKLV